MRVDEVQAPQTEETTNPFGWGFACGAAVATAVCVALFVFAFLPLYRSKAAAVKYAMQEIPRLRAEIRDLKADRSDPVGVSPKPVGDQSSVPSPAQIREALAREDARIAQQIAEGRTPVLERTVLPLYPAPDRLLRARQAAAAKRPGILHRIGRR